MIKVIIMVDGEDCVGQPFSHDYHYKQNAATIIDSLDRNTSQSKHNRYSNLLNPNIYKKLNS